MAIFPFYLALFLIQIISVFAVEISPTQARILSSKCHLPLSTVQKVFKREPKRLFKRMEKQPEEEVK